MLNGLDFFSSTPPKAIDINANSLGWTHTLLTSEMTKTTSPLALA